MMVLGFCAAVNDTVVHDEVLAEIETDKVS